MNIESLRDLLLYIMTNRVKSSLQFGWYGGMSSFSLYGGDEPASQAQRMDEIVAVRNDYVIVKVKTLNAPPTLHVIPIANILQIQTDFDFLGIRVD